MRGRLSEPHSRHRAPQVDGTSITSVDDERAHMISELIKCVPWTPSVSTPLATTTTAHTLDFSSLYTPHTATMAHTRPAWLRAIVNDTDVDPCLPYKSAPVLSQAPSKVQIRAAAAKRSRPALQQQDKNLQCKHCGKVFKRVCNYREHQRVHSNEYKFACSVPGCNRKFMWRSSIQAHMRSHQSKAQRRSRSPISKCRVPTRHYPCTFRRTCTCRCTCSIRTRAWWRCAHCSSAGVLNGATKYAYYRNCPLIKAASYFSDVDALLTLLWCTNIEAVPLLPLPSRILPSYSHLLRSRPCKHSIAITLYLQALQSACS